jgi:hypothetical protein
LHLLLPGEALVDHDVDRGFHEGGRDRLAVTPAFAVVRDDGAVVADVASELGRRRGEARPVGIGALQRVEVVGQILDPAQGLSGVAVPQALVQRGRMDELAGGG